MSNTARNYHAHGGGEWVIGGKVTFLPGAIVEGAEGLFDLPPAGQPVLPCVPDSEATTVAQLREGFNQLLAVMKAAGVMATAPTETSESGTTPEPPEQGPAP